MSEQPGQGTERDGSQDAGSQDTGSQDEPLADVPPVAGGTDDSPPAQGEGATDSW